MAKDLKCLVNAHRHIAGDVRTFRLPAQTEKVLHSRTNPIQAERAARFRIGGASAPFLGLTSDPCDETENRERRRTVFLRDKNSR